MALGAYTHMYAFVQERDFKKLGLKVLYFKHLLYGIPAQKFNRYLKVCIAPIYVYWTFIINYTGICTGIDYIDYVTGIAHGGAHSIQISKNS